jgi:acyl-CoA thioester hydrolase
MFHWPVRVYYEDTDSGGVVYHANYLKFMERARSEWLRNFGIDQTVLSAEHGIIFVVRSIAVRYLQPARFNDLLHVAVRPAAHRGAGLELAQSVSRARTADEEPGAGELLCTAEVQLACVDSRRFRPRRLPDFLLAEIERES